MDDTVEDDEDGLFLELVEDWFREGELLLKLDEWVVVEVDADVTKDDISSPPDPDPSDVDVDRPSDSMDAMVLVFRIRFCCCCSYKSLL